MTVQINSNYLENYAREYSEIVCSRFFSDRQFISGQEILQLTNSIQVNFFVIKRMFELWQEELSKLKSSPFFDYRDIAVHEALTQFMNVLSRRIKVQSQDFRPLLQEAVSQAIQVATDPVQFFQNEVRKAPSGKINEYLKENKKYYKWNDRVVTFLIDKAGFGYDMDSYLKAISANYQVIQDSLESVNLLLATLGDVKAFNLDAYLIKEESKSGPVDFEETPTSEASYSFFEEEVVESRITESPKMESLSTPTPRETITKITQVGAVGSLDSASLKAHFASETYKGMKGILGELSESLAINQRFMFTKELFDGNADLLRHALATIDGLGTFEDAVDLINSRYVQELNWDVQSEAVHEFLQLIYRKFS